MPAAAGGSRAHQCATVAPGRCFKQAPRPRITTGEALGAAAAARRRAAGAPAAAAAAVREYASRPRAVMGGRVARRRASVSSSQASWSSSATPSASRQPMPELPGSIVISGPGFGGDEESIFAKHIEIA
eukprot:scaffold3843_cov117-Isochrysis_galbana.AAC.1